jgi:hypothetical protein
MENVRRYIDFLKDVENAHSYIERSISYLEGLKNQNFERFEDKLPSTPTLTAAYQEALDRLQHARGDIQSIIDQFVQSPFEKQQTEEEVEGEAEAIVEEPVSEPQE